MATVIQFRRHDCWRTWFFEECEGAGLFGVNEEHLSLLRLSAPGVRAYHVGTEVYLEDAPVLPASGERFHRVCGPYRVIPATPLPDGASVVHEDDGIPIVYREAQPNRGPWGDRVKHRRGVFGLDLKYRQTAKRFNYYPYRFRIERSARWEEFKILHLSPCELLD